MREDNRLQELIARAREESAPPAAVADVVVARLARRERKAESDPAGWIAAGAALAAGVTVVLAWPLVAALSDPLWSLFSNLSWGLR